MVFEAAIKELNIRAAYAKQFLLSMESNAFDYNYNEGKIRKWVSLECCFILAWVICHLVSKSWLD